MLGPEHPDTIDSISNLAVCLGDMGRWAGSNAAEGGWGVRCLYHLCYVSGQARQAGSNTCSHIRSLVVTVVQLTVFTLAHTLGPDISNVWLFQASKADPP